jgi:hypothetical protein
MVYEYFVAYMLIQNLLCFLPSMSDTLPTGQLSNVPWRRTGVKYTNNEAYFDVVGNVAGTALRVRIYS